MFGRAKRQADAAELARLRNLVRLAGGESAEQILAAVDDLRTENLKVESEIRARRNELAELARDVVETRDTAILQEVGIYDYAHPAEDSVELKDRLAALKNQIKETAKGNGAIVSSSNFTLNNSQAQGRRMVSDFSKLMLRAYNAECDSLVRSMRPHRLEKAIERLTKTRATIARLGKLMEIQVSDQYHRLRIEELRLVSDFLAKKEEEKERMREERQLLREEAKALAELKREEEKLRKERDHHRSVLEQLLLSGAADADIEAARARLAESDDALAGVIAREANVRAGYVYVISNVGSHGPGIVKIGMTRRLDPMDRVRELSNAAVPFRFDVHALFFADDALGLEQELHAHFADRRVNLVNFRREYFYATPQEVEQVLREKHGQLLEFHADPDAVEWHQSVNAHKEMESNPSLRQKLRESASFAQERVGAVDSLGLGGRLDDDDDDDDMGDDDADDDLD
jgi:hypothetical protein